MSTITHCNRIRKIATVRSREDDSFVYLDLRSGIVDIEVSTDSSTTKLRLPAAVIHAMSRAIYKMS